MQLKLYTKKEAQSGHITYTDEEKGYKCDVFSFSWGLTAITVTITIAAICMTCKVLYFLLKAESKPADVNRAVFFSFGIITFLVNIADVGFLVYVVYVYISVYTQFVQNESNHEKSGTDPSTVLNHVLVKVFELSVGILVFGIGGAITSCCSPFLPQPELHVTCNFCTSKRVYFLHFANFFYFTYMVGLKVLPTFLILLIAPIETISVLIFFVSLLSSCVMVVTIVILRSEIHTLKKRVEARNKIELCQTICSASIYFLALISIVLLVVVFLKVLAATTNSNAPYLATVILSLGSTILTILGGYLTTQILSKENTQKSDLESGTEMIDTVNEDTAGTSTENGTPAAEKNGEENGEDDEATAFLGGKKKCRKYS